MAAELNVLLNGALVGQVVRSSGERLRFGYEPTYRNNAAATPLSMSMPLTSADHTHAVIAPWMSGLLPDNPDVLTRWAAQFGLSSTEPFALLGSPIGEDCAGAVQFVTNARLDEVTRAAGSVEWLSEADVEDRLRALRENETAWLGRNRTDDRGHRPGQFSLAGRQRKTALLFDGQRWGQPSGRTPTTHILKPPVTRVGDDSLYEQDTNEHLCLEAAARAGLSAAGSHVQAFGRERAIVVTRYDRVQAGDDWVRVHQEDMCQALSVPPSKKYQWQGGPGLRQIASAFRAASPPSTAESNIVRFLDGVAWNWIVAGPDGHAKNYSALLAGREVRLAPLYDITSGLPYWRDHDLSMAMKLDDGYEMHNYTDPWPSAATSLGLDPGFVHDRVVALCDSAPGAFSDAADTSGVRQLKGLLPPRLVDHVAKRSRWAHRLLGRRVERSVD